MDFDGMEIFSGSKHTERKEMGASVTAWRRNNPDVSIVEVRTLQSSDSEFHCVTIIIFYKNKK